MPKNVTAMSIIFIFIFEIIIIKNSNNIEIGTIADIKFKIKLVGIKWIIAIIDAAIYPTHLIGLAFVSKAL